METVADRREKDPAPIGSIVLFALGLGFISLSLSFLPVIGILIGGAFMAAALYPWLPFFRQRKVKIEISAVSDNHLESIRLPVAILSATSERDGFDFDPGQVDPTSARFGPLKAAPSEDMSDPMIYRRNLVDVNNDGVPDLILYFDGDTAGVGAGTKEVCLWAKMRGGERIIGCNEVNYGYESGLNEMVEYK